MDSNKKFCLNTILTHRKLRWSTGLNSRINGSQDDTRARSDI